MDSTQNTPAPSESDSQDILDSVNAFAPDIQSALQAVVQKKPAFQKLAVGGAVKLVKQDLASLASATNSFENALISKAPVRLSFPPAK